jgi:hypothetical protein
MMLEDMDWATTLAGLKCDALLFSSYHKTNQKNHRLQATSVIFLLARNFRILQLISSHNDTLLVASI